MAEANFPPREEAEFSDLTDLRNRIFIMRHGQSEANARGLIVCAPDIGCSGYGLTDLGRSQVLESCKTLESLLQSSSTQPLSPASDLVIVSSDFKRASETASIVRDYFKIASSEVIYESALRERDFGRLNLTSDPNYQKIWDIDCRDPQHTEYGCESVTSVVLRTARLLQRLDREYKNKVILLVSHGDTLQILSTLFLGIQPNNHKNLPNLLPAAVRELKQ